MLNKENTNITFPPYLRASLPRLDGVLCDWPAHEKLGRPHHEHRSVTGKRHSGVPCEMELSRLTLEKGGTAGHRAPSLGQEWWGRGLPSYLVAIGTGAVVQLHRILATRPVVLAWAGEAGIALGYNVDVHRPWTAKAQSI